MGRINIKVKGAGNAKLPMGLKMTDLKERDIKIKQLVNELAEWCKDNNLPYLSADELAAEEYVTDEQRGYLYDYINRWDRVA